MAVRIRLTRTGRKNLPSFRIAVFDGRTRRDGPALEVVGWFNPLNRDPGKGFKVQSERLQEWVNRGARMTLAVRQLLHKQGAPVPVPARTAAAKAPSAPRAKRKPAPRPPAEYFARMKRKKSKRASRLAGRVKRAAAKAAAAAAKPAGEAKS